MSGTYSGLPGVMLAECRAMIMEKAMVPRSLGVSTVSTRCDTNEYDGQDFFFCPMGRPVAAHLLSYWEFRGPETVSQQPGHVLHATCILCATNLPTTFLTTSPTDSNVTRMITDALSYPSSKTIFSVTAQTRTCVPLRKKPVPRKRG